MIEYYLFDMDHTLIESDSDVSWKSFAVKHGLAGPEALTEAAGFYEDYKNGVLDVDAFNRFQLREFQGKTRPEIARLSQAHFDEFVRPHIRQKALDDVRRFLSAGTPAAVISSTNAELVRPVAEAFGIPVVASTELEFDASGRATGRISGVYTAGTGKVVMAEELARKTGIRLENSAYFGDSGSDIPILNAVGFPFAVSPDSRLRQFATERKWPILDWSN